MTRRLETYLNKRKGHFSYDGELTQLISDWTKVKSVRNFLRASELPNYIRKGYLLLK